MAAERTPGLLRSRRRSCCRRRSATSRSPTSSTSTATGPARCCAIYTELHRNILDVFNEYGVQIMTPAYEGDPEQPKVVPKDQWYAAPARPPDRAPGGA